MSSAPLPPLLTVPVEIRLQIYGIIFDKRLPHRLDSFLSILSVCRQFREEAYPVLLKDDRYFKNLDLFSQWTVRANRDLLPYVRSITLHLFEDSLAPFGDTLGNWIEWIGRTPPLLTDKHWEVQYAQEAFFIAPPIPYTQESAKPDDLNSYKSAISLAWDALSSVKSLQKLRILLGHSHVRIDTRPFKAEQLVILDMVGCAFENLQELSFSSSLVPLDWIRRLRNLRKLEFSGYSKSSPQEMVEILKNLPHLESISIQRYPEFYDQDRAIVTAELPKYISVTPDAIARLKPLKTFKITHMTSRLVSHFLTVSMIEALGRHSESLHTLKIFSDRLIDEALFESILAFLPTTRLRYLDLRLEIPVTYKDLKIEEHLPQSCPILDRMVLQIEGTNFQAGSFPKDTAAART